MANNIIVLQDSKEQMPWDFTFYGLEQRVQSLKTGDYTLLGFENKLCIERKRTTGEIAINLGSKNNQFYAEINRMKTFEYRYLILEFSQSDLASFPLNSGIPYKLHSKLRMNAKYMSSCINRIRDDFGVEVIFANDRNSAINEVLNIFNMIVSNDNKAIF